MQWLIKAEKLHNKHHDNKSFLLQKQEGNMAGLSNKLITNTTTPPLF